MPLQPRDNSHILTAEAIIDELDVRPPEAAVSPVERAQLHLLLSIARSLNSLDTIGIEVTTR